MKKFYVLDTNVLIHDPTAILKFEDNHVIVPIEVIREIDQFKRDVTDRGQNARHVSRLLDGLRTRRNLAEGVDLPNGGLLQVVCDPDINLIHNRNGMDADTHILRVAMQTKSRHPDAPVVLVSKDINLRIRADVLGLKAEDYESDRVQFSEITGEVPQIALPAAEIERFAAEGSMPLPARAASLPRNEYVLLRPDDGSRHTALARVSADKDKLVALIDIKKGVFGVRPRNMQQYFAMDALLNDRIRLVTIMGKAGTGKTLLSIAAALHKVLRQSKYKGLLISRPTLPVGKDLGFLPGTITEKLEPWIQPINDALGFLMETTAGKPLDAAEHYQELWDSGIIRVEPLTYIRGRSIANHFIVVDESQNLTPLEVKTIITRIGEGSKIVLAGDPYQIDNPYIDVSSSGFLHLAKRFRDQPIAAHCELVKGERSELAELAANLL